LHVFETVYSDRDVLHVVFSITVSFITVYYARVVVSCLIVFYTPHHVSKNKQNYLCHNFAKFTNLHQLW